MKRTMLIVSHALELGGAERSLIGFLEALDESKWEIDLFLLRQEGELMDAIPDKVHLLPPKAAYTVLAHPMKATLKEGHVLLTMARLYGKTAAVIYDHKHNYRDSDVNLEYSHKYTSPFMPRIQPQKEYDLAVSFLTPHYIVTKKVNAKKKIAWIHTDYSQVQIDILSETKKLAAAGFHEIVLTGIHLSSFGVDREFKKTDANSFVKLQGKYLLELLQKMAQVSGIERLRLGSLEPRIITEEFVKKLAEIPEVCPHFHLSLQSGCDATLKRMNRHYSSQEYLQGVEILRKYFKDPAITTDIIVGFPGETEEEFKTTCDFAKKVSFAQIHVFKYSRRHGTVADRMEDQVDEQVKNSRSDRLLAIEAELEKQYQQKFPDQTQKVLIEEPVLIEGTKYLVGYNERYVRIAVPYEEGVSDESLCNSLIDVHINGSLEGDILLGKRERACNL